MKARYWPCKGVYPAVAASSASLRTTSASLCGDASGRVHESPREGPAEGVRLGAIPMADEAEDVPSERGHALEAAVAQDAALKDAEPDLDLVDPRGMQRRVDEAEAISVLLVEPRPASVTSVVVQVEVVPDDVDTATLVALPSACMKASSARASRCRTTRPNTSPVRMSKDASREHVPRRRYSNSWRTMPR
jgi:hypothetical protein